MKKIILYLVIIIISLLAAIKFRVNIGTFFHYEFNGIFKSLFFTIWSATLGSVFYCLRAVYENKSVRKNWDPDWEVWYYIRPITGSIIGFAVWLAIKSGLLILSTDSSNINIWASSFLGFIAGLNVKNIQLLLEEIMHKKVGLSKSNQSKN
ncbi:MAG: hypothetical protein ABUK01_17990 [Leptospirales bacterium]